MLFAVCGICKKKASGWQCCLNHDRSGFGKSECENSVFPIRNLSSRGRRERGAEVAYVYVCVFVARIIRCKIGVSLPPAATANYGNCLRVIACGQFFRQLSEMYRPSIELYCPAFVHVVESGEENAMMPRGTLAPDGRLIFSSCSRMEMYHMILIRNFFKQELVIFEFVLSLWVCELQAIVEKCLAINYLVSF